MGYTSMAGDPGNPLRAVVTESRVAIVWLAVFSLFINLLILTSPIYMMQVYDRVLASGRIETLVMLTVIAGVAVLVLGLLGDGAQQNSGANRPVAGTPAVAGPDRRRHAGDDAGRCGERAGAA